MAGWRTLHMGTWRIVAPTSVQCLLSRPFLVMMTSATFSVSWDELVAVFLDHFIASRRRRVPSIAGSDAEVSPWQ